MSLLELFLESLDPRGRCNRRAFLMVALALLAAQVLIVAVYLILGAVPDGPMLVVLNIFFLWLTTAIIIKRLHDIGRSAWALVWCTAGVVIWSVVLAIALMLTLPQEAFLPGALGYNMAAFGTALPVFIGVLWLHCAHGQDGPNRFGAEPADFGFSRRPSKATLLGDALVAG